MYSVHQHWDPLKVCMVGKSYAPEFYSFIKNSKVRTVMERIAAETEEDYQKLIKLLKSFNVEILRPDLTDDYRDYTNSSGKIAAPPMTPRDYSAMVGETFYFQRRDPNTNWQKIRGDSWPESAPCNMHEFQQLPDFVKEELVTLGLEADHVLDNDRYWDQALKTIKNTIVYNAGIDSAGLTRVGKDLYFGTNTYHDDQLALLQSRSSLFPDYRCHVINTGGHADSTYCPVVPGLIVSLHDVPTYAETFPDWEVVFLPGQSWDKVRPFLDLKQKNKGKWWVPGEELNNEFTEFVESWLTNWVGYVEETVFDVNMLVIDEKNVICNNYNKQVFDAFSRYGVTPHVVNFRHRYFWDGGLHCITSDVAREGKMRDYFPGRN